MNYKYTVIKSTILGKELRTHHYERKADAMQEVAALIGEGYQVKVMAYSVWFANQHMGY